MKEAVACNGRLRLLAVVPCGWKAQLLLLQITGACGWRKQVLAVQDSNSSHPGHFVSYLGSCLGLGARS